MAVSNGCLWIDVWNTGIHNLDGADLGKQGEMVNIADMLAFGLAGLFIGIAAGYWFGWKDGWKDRENC